ncbi:peptidase C13 family protein [Abortiporus biennis]
MTPITSWVSFTVVSISRLLLLWLCLLSVSNQAFGSVEHDAERFFNNHAASGHTNNWAVLVCSSRYWFNYRHMSNALAIYRTVKRLGIPDSNIILMLADDAACNTRNKFPGCVYANSQKNLDLYGDNIEVDYRGYEVTVENFLRVLTGRVDPSIPRSKRLLTDDRSNIFVYMTGHGGNEFLKFQDNEEISAFDIADAFEQMWQKKRYNEIFFMIDTCQANTMYSKFYSPNILATGSSEIHENSYSYENDADIGVAVIDSFTHHLLQFMEGINKTSQATFDDLFKSYDPATIHSHPGIRTDLFRRPLKSTYITDFFGGVAQAEVLPPIPLSILSVLNGNMSSSPTSDNDVSSAPVPTKSLPSYEVPEDGLYVAPQSKLSLGTSSLRAWSSTEIVFAWRSFSNFKLQDPLRLIVERVLYPSWTSAWRMCCFQFVSVWLLGPMVVLRISRSHTLKTNLKVVGIMSEPNSYTSAKYVVSNVGSLRHPLDGLSLASLSGESLPFLRANVPVLNVEHGVVNLIVGPLLVSMRCLDRKGLTVALPCLLIVTSVICVWIIFKFVGDAS